MKTPSLEEAKADNQSAHQFIRAHAEKLAALMADPHPCLFTWAKAVAIHMQALSDFWNQF